MIPAEAIDAAARVMLDKMYDDKTLKVDDEDRYIMRAALEAAAPHMQTAAEKAMQDIGAALESYFDGSQSEPNALNSIARTVGAYSIERIGGAK